MFWLKTISILIDGEGPMNKSRLLGASLACLTSLCGIGTANAAFVLTIDNLATTGIDVSITDEGVGDQAPSKPGAIVFNGSLGVFTVNVTTGISKPLLDGSPQLMDLNSVSVNSTGAGQLFIQLTDTDFGPTTDPFSLGIEATVTHTAGGQVSSFDAEISDGDTGPVANYGGTGPSGPEGPDGPPGIDLDFCADASNAQDACVDGPFFGASGNAGGFGGSSVIPIPAAVWLFGSGLLGMVGIARRKKAA